MSRYSILGWETPVENEDLPTVRYRVTWDVTYQLEHCTPAEMRDKLAKLHMNLMHIVIDTEMRGAYTRDVDGARVIDLHDLVIQCK